MNLASTRPLGERTTVIDIADRDEMDDDLFPLQATQSWFTRDAERRLLPFSTNIQEFVYKGTAEFGGRLVFELGSVNACDLLWSVMLQVRLGHWLAPEVLHHLRDGSWQYEDPDTAWSYANSLGTALVARADFMLDDQILETVDGDFANVWSRLWPDVNLQFGTGADAYGRQSIPNLVTLPDRLDTFPQTGIFPTTNGTILCILPFSFQRIRLRNGFPLAAVKEGTLRVAITLRPFRECVRRLNGYRDTCDQTPLGLPFRFLDIPNNTVVTAEASTVVPPFEDVRLVTYGALLDGKLLKAIRGAPFDRMYRDVATFRFDEPKKYVVNTSGALGGTVTLSLPLELNNPCEEILWVIRRKGVSLNNEWTNYSSLLEVEYNPNNPEFTPFLGMLERAALQINGETIVEERGSFFRNEIAKAHRGGIVGWSQFIYGYAFAQEPGRVDPKGWFNASRASDVRLRVEVRPPKGAEDLEFEVLVWGITMNWVRFENGVANRVFSS